MKALSEPGEQSWDWGLPSLVNAVEMAQHDC
jgi:hypothetical protein